MEINYDIIIKYLVGSNQSKVLDILNTKINNNSINNIENYITKKHDSFNSIHFPEIFNKIFLNDYYRYGITIYDDKNNNISFISSILTLLDTNFVIPYENNELIQIKNFKNDLIDKYKKKNLSKCLKIYDKFFFKDKLNKTVDSITIQYITDILLINIFIFDFKNNNINIVYPSNKLNIEYNFILVSKYDDYYEPIILTDNLQKIFNKQDNIIIKLLELSNTIKYLDEDILDKKFIINNINIDINNLNKTKLNKLKINELIEIAIKLKLNIIHNNKPLIKKQIIDLIYNNSNN